jgi:hypothetical protein
MAQNLLRDEARQKGAAIVVPKMTRDIFMERKSKRLFLAVQVFLAEQLRS